MKLDTTTTILQAAAWWLNEPTKFDENEKMQFRD